MKRIITLIIPYILIIILCACGGNEYTPKATTSNSPYNQKTASHIAIGLKDFLDYSKYKPIILIKVDDYSKGKNAHVKCIYVIENNKSKTYNIEYMFSTRLTDEISNSNGSISLGELSKMNDENILAMLKVQEQKQLNTAIQIWRDTFDAFNDKAKIYKPEPLRYFISIETDSTGNSTKSETLYLPSSGIDGHDPICSPYIFLSEKGDYYKYLSSPEESQDGFSLSCYREYEKYNTIQIYGYTKQFVVYNSNYITLGDSCIFRTDNPIDDSNTFITDFALDGVSTNGIDYIDPTRSDLASISCIFLISI